MVMDDIEKRILAEVADIHKTPTGAYNIRYNGEAQDRKSTEHIVIERTEHGLGLALC